MSGRPPLWEIENPHVSGTLWSGFSVTPKTRALPTDPWANILVDDAVFTFTDANGDITHRWTIGDGIEFDVTVPEKLLIVPPGDVITPPDGGAPAAVDGVLVAPVGTLKGVLKLWLPTDLVFEVLHVKLDVLEGQAEPS